MLQTDRFQSYKLILFVALFVRLIATIFSQGYGMHDDHYLTIVGYHGQKVAAEHRKVIVSRMLD